MKKLHLIAIILIAVAIGVILTTINDSGTYVSFSEAFSQPGEEFHVVGQLNRDKEMIYDPVADPNLFTFYMLDQNGNEQKVHLHKSKPQDFERSEQIVLIGKAGSDAFHAREVLMKCPSKYNEGAGEFKTEEEMRVLREQEQAG